jgi:hypothetical protein
VRHIDLPEVLADERFMLLVPEVWHCR